MVPAPRLAPRSALLLLALLPAVVTPALSQTLTSTPAPKSFAKFKPQPHQQASEHLPSNNVQQDAEQDSAPTGIDKHLFKLHNVETSLDDSLARFASHSKPHAAMRRNRKLIEIVPLIKGQTITRTEGVLYVGTPLQGPYAVTYDTSSSDTWVVGYRSPNFEAGATPPFQSSRSSTYLSYGYSVTARDGSETNTLRVSRDTIGLPVYQSNGDLTTLKITNYDFGVATKQIKTSSGPSYGIVGFGWPSRNQLQTANNQPLPWAVAKRLDLGGFSFWYNTSAGARTSIRSLKEGAGLLVFGPAQSELYDGELLDLNIDNSNGYWQTTLTAGGAEDESQAEGEWNVIFDTGSEFNFLPAEVVESYFDGLDYAGAGYRVPLGEDSGDVYCLKPSALSTAPRLTLTVTDGDNIITFTTRARAMLASPKLYQLKNGQQCYLLGLVGGDARTYILGQAWLRNYYTVWSYDNYNMQFGVRAEL